jgi:hypothetical protein
VEKGCECGGCGHESDEEGEKQGEERERPDTKGIRVGKQEDSVLYKSNGRKLSRFF